MSEVATRKVKLRVQSQTLTGILSMPKPCIGCGAIILNPHPLFGGNMENIVVHAMNNILIDAGHATLRFNFRGTERKSLFAGMAGAFEDANAGLSTLLQQTSIQHAGVAGYSFGGSVALLLALRKPVRYLVTLSASFDMLSAGINDLSKLKDISCPVLLFHGNNDMIIPEQDMSQLASLIGSKQMETVILENEGHFYIRSLPKVQKELEVFLGKIAC